LWHRSSAMFFMVTYGTICLISLLEHFAADPSYRPTFKSRWYISLVGALLPSGSCLRMNAPYALLSLIIMGPFMPWSLLQQEGKGIGQPLPRGGLPVEQAIADPGPAGRPGRSERTLATLHHMCFPGYLHEALGLRYTCGGSPLNMALAPTSITSRVFHRRNQQGVQDVLNKLIHLAAAPRTGFTSTPSSQPFLHLGHRPGHPAFRDIRQGQQHDPVSSFQKPSPKQLEEALNTHDILYATGFDLCVLSTSYKGFGYKKQIHISGSPHPTTTMPT
jgi:hypothetical protein